MLMCSVESTGFGLMMARGVEDGLAQEPDGVRIGSEKAHVRVAHHFAAASDLLVTRVDDQVRICLRQRPLPPFGDLGVVELRRLVPIVLERVQELAADHPLALPALQLSCRPL